MAEFVTSNGFTVRENVNGGIYVDNLYIGPAYVSALIEYLGSGEDG